MFVVILLCLLMASFGVADENSSSSYVDVDRYVDIIYSRTICDKALYECKTRCQRIRYRSRKNTCLCRCLKYTACPTCEVNGQQCSTLFQLRVSLWKGVDFDLTSDHLSIPTHIFIKILEVLDSRKKNYQSTYF